MKKAILISIKPKYVADILNGKKTIEIRKNCPKQLKGDGVTKPEPIDVYIYCSKEKPYIAYEKHIDEYILCKSLKELGEYGNEVSPTSNMCALQESGAITNGHILAKFKLNCVEPLINEEVQEYEMTFNDWRTKTLSVYDFHSKAHLTFWELLGYLDKKQGYAWYIDNLKIFDEPKELKEFGVKRPPRSWCYIEEK